MEPALGNDILRLQDRKLPAAERADLEAHLGMCHACQVVLELETALAAGWQKGAPAPARTWWAKGRSWAFAAALLLLLALPLGWPDRSVSTVPSTGFIENRNQVDAPVRYLCPGTASSVFFLPESITFDLRSISQDSLLAKQQSLIQNLGPEDREDRGCVLRITFRDANPAVRLEARKVLGTRYHYFLGNEAESWQAGIPTFGELVYRDLWPGVNLVFREHAGRINYEIEGKLPQPLQDLFGIEGQDSVTIDLAEGSARIHTAVGPFINLMPQADRARGTFVWREGHVEQPPPLAAMDHAQQLVASSFVGGDIVHLGTDMAIAGDGGILVGGMISTLRFPERTGPYERSRRGHRSDAFVAKFSSDLREKIWCAYLGGESNIEGVSALATRSDGAIVLIGLTDAADFPATPEAFAATESNGQDWEDWSGFVTILSADGEQLLHSTTLGGERQDTPRAVELDAGGAIYIAGGTRSRDFPLLGDAFRPDADSHPEDFSDVFALRLQPDLSAVDWSLRVGGLAQDQALDLHVDDEVLALTGLSGSTDFPVSEDGFDRDYNGGEFDAFVMCLDPATGQLRWSSYLGGSGDWDWGYCIARGPDGGLLVAGDAYSADFPVTPDAYDPEYNSAVEQGGNDVFLSRFDAETGALSYSTFIGGSNTERATAMVIDERGNLILVGPSASLDFPTTPGALDRVHNGGSFDAFLLHFDLAANELSASTLLGGRGDDWAWAIGLDSQGTAVMLGQTSSLDFPVTRDAHDPIPSGTLYDVFVAKIRLDPVPES